MRLSDLGDYFTLHRIFARDEYRLDGVPERTAEGLARFLSERGHEVEIRPSRKNPAEGHLFSRRRLQASGARGRGLLSGIPESVISGSSCVRPRL